MYSHVLHVCAQNALLLDKQMACLHDIVVLHGCSHMFRFVNLNVHVHETEILVNFEEEKKHEM